MKTITFYSYKGGVGRTLTAANFALYLAKLGNKVSVLDFDLGAPGLDSKLDIEIPPGHPGLLDYILQFQATGDNPGTLEDLALRIPIESNKSASGIRFIPAGDYNSPEYPNKLSSLDWSMIFSGEREGVAFFQEFLRRVGTDLGADYLIVDSRTGISEIGGLCTQQLADEVVMLTSLSKESIKVTKRIAELIRRSEVARTLGKTVDVKIVVSRIPRMEDLLGFRRWCCETFGIEDSKLFMLFSYPALEVSEFLAIHAPSREEDLVADYVQLFYGLDVELASQSIKDEIDEVTLGMLAQEPEEAERRILELASLYPDSDVYRTVMRFFRLRDNTEMTRKFGLKLLDRLPNDPDGEAILVKSYLDEFEEEGLSRADLDVATKVIEPIWSRGELGLEAAIAYADMLEQLERFSECLAVGMKIIDEDGLSDDQLARVRGLAATSAFRSGERDLAAYFVEGIPRTELVGPLALVAVETAHDNNNPDQAFALAKELLELQLEPDLLRLANSVAIELDRKEELITFIKQNLRNTPHSRRLIGTQRFMSVLRELGMEEAILSEIEGPRRGR